jgi:Ca-activated chloride channel family protein
MRGFFHNKEKKAAIFTLVLSMLVLFVFSGTGGAGTDKVVMKVETDRAVLPSDGERTVVVKVSLDAPPPPPFSVRPPVNLAIVLDRSGSMSGDKIEKAKEAAIEAVKHLGPRDMFSLVIYDHNVETIVPATPVKNLDGIVSRIRSIEPGGSTALFGGVSQGAAELRKNTGDRFVHRIILLSDGLANVGPQTPEDLGRLGAALIKEKISVTTVGVGTDYNEDLMARLSQNSDGNIYFVENSGALPGIFNAELGNVLSVVARDVRVIIKVPEDVVPVSIIGREGRIMGHSVEFSMNQLYGNQEKFALVEMKIPKNKSGKDLGKELEIARATVYYENPVTKTKERTEAVGRVSFSQDEKKVKKSTNVAVVRDYQLNLNALAQEKAINEADKGKKKEAVETLKSSAAQLKSVGSAISDEKLLKEAEALEQKADLIEKEGMSKKSRKVLRTESYQMKNQQYEK